MDSTYKTFDEWYNEIEGFGTRGERAELMASSTVQPIEIRKWLRTAWELGAKSNE